MDPDLAFRAALRDKRAYPVLAAAAVFVVAVVAIGLLPADGEGGESGLAVGPSPSSSRLSPPSPKRADAPTQVPEFPPLRLEPGGYYIQTPDDIPGPPIRVHLTMPAGWASGEGGTAVWKPDGVSPYGAGPSLAVHAVTGVATEVCRPGAIERPDSKGRFKEIGPTIDDMTTALATLLGPERPGPTDVMLDGYPAKRLFLTDILDSCGGPEGRLLWENAKGSHFGFLKGATATIYVVDVDGNRLVITSYERGSSVQEIEELDAIIASIDIERWPSGVSRIDRQSLTVEGVPLSFSVPTGGWGQFGGISINKSIVGPQGAEAMIYWTGFPDGLYADPCADVLSPSVGRSAADLAKAVSTAPGTALVTGPSDVIVGGRAAKHVVVTVREDVGCDPGFFYTWEDMEFGPLWTVTQAGDTIRVWIVDVAGTRLFIAGETNPDADAQLEQEIQEIVESIRFE